MVYRDKSFGLVNLKTVLIDVIGEADRKGLKIELLEGER